MWVVVSNRNDIAFLREKRTFNNFKQAHFYMRFMNSVYKDTIMAKWSIKWEKVS